MTTKKLLPGLFFAFTPIYLTSCITVAPVHGTYEKAATLGKGNVELSGSFTHHVVSSGGEWESINNNIGFRAGYGISDKVDIKARYEKLMVINKEPGVDFKANYFSVIPKVNLSPGKTSLFVPISMYRFNTTTEYGQFKSSSYSIAPHIIRTFTAASNKSDFSLSSHLEYIFSKGNESSETEDEFLGGINIGAGFSSDLSKWAIRPEIGWLTDMTSFSGSVFNFGVSLQFIIPTAKKGGTKK